VAPHQKKAHRLRAHLVFLDETGMLMAPLLRRSWAPRGQRPVVHQRTNSHTKVSVIGALVVAPGRDRVGLYFRLHPDANIDTKRVTAFLDQLRRQVRGRIVLLWDRFGPHKSQAMKTYLGRHGRLYPEYFPPYAPELNPVEGPWGYLKINPMANLALTEVDELAAATRRHGRSVQRRESLLRAFIKHASLPLRLR
jgi:transposase